jgi:glycosyltransferase involved in cell wall biosynthesis
VRVTLDATPLLGVRTGIGRYVDGLLAALARTSGADEILQTTAFTLRGHRRLGDVLPDGVRRVGAPAPARLLRELWARTEHPRIETLCGTTDVFHATNYVLPPLGSAAGVLNVHDLTFLHRPHMVHPASLRYAELVPRSIARAAAVITLSEAVAQQVRTAYEPRVPVIPVPLGVDTAWFEAAPPDASLRARLGLPSSYVLFVGTQEPRKNLSTLLAAHRLVPDAPPLALVGARGWGPEHDTSGCIGLGYLDDVVLRQVVAGASALVLPSHDEGFGLPVLEALATGTPVVASDIEAHVEVGADLVRYADPASTDALAHALADVLSSPGDPRLRRQRAEGFTWERCARLTRAAYERALSR